MGKAGKNQIMALLLIVFVVSFSVFSHRTITVPSSVLVQAQEKTVLTFGCMLSDCNDTPKVVEKESLSLYRLTEETSRLRAGRSGFTCFAAFYFWAMQLYFLAVLFPYSLLRKDIMPSYSIISYIHRSHGKKTALMIS